MNNTQVNHLKDEQGQTLIEFVLLLAAIGIISVTFMTQINKFTANRWEAMANVILDDPNQQIKLR